MIMKERGTIEKRGYKISWWYEGFTCFHVEKDGQEIYHGMVMGQLLNKLLFNPFYDESDARQEVEQALKEGYGFNYIRIFLNDLARSQDITWEENGRIMADLIAGKFGKVECSFPC